MIKTRDTRPSQKQELGRFLSSIDQWSIIESKEKNHLFANFINTGFNILTPIKEKKVHINDPPWITAELYKDIIKCRQRAFHKKDLYRFYRNRVNTERKKCQSRVFLLKVKHPKESKPSL